MASTLTNVTAFNYSNGEPQTPKRTPTSVAYTESAFHTPKLESSFYDPRVTWNTADPYASSPEFLKTPQRFGLTTPSNHNYLHGLADRDSTLDPSASFAQSLSPQLERNSLSGTVRASKTTGSTKKGNKASAKKAAAGQGNNGDKDSIDSTKSSAASMQTPPPTSTGRRKMRDKDNTGNTNTGAGNDNNVMGPPDSSHLETPSRVSGISSNLFDAQSPNLFQVGASSTGSPFFPQNRLFWDQDTQFPAGSLDLVDSYGDPFGPNQTSAFDAFDQSPMQNNSLHVPQFQTMHGTLGNNHSYHTSSLGPVDSGLYPTSFSTSPRLPTVRDEDPAMFLSSPARRFGFSEPVLPQDTPPRLETRQPYHHQTEESKREKRLKELKRARSLARRKAEAADEAADALRQSRSAHLLSRRSSTHSTIPHSRHASGQSSFSVAPSSSGVRKTPAKGRLSPVKTQAPPLPRPSSASITTPVESVVLKIGKDGRAKTETKVAQSPPGFSHGPGMELDESSTESETDSSDEFDFSIARSANPSFNIPPESTPRRPTIARAHSTSRPHSKSSSYSSTVASSHSGQHSPWTSSSRGSGRLPQFSAQQEGWMTSRRHSTNPVGGHSRHQSITDSEVTQDDDDTGDAQHALKQLLKGRSRQARQPAAIYNQKTRSSQSFAALRSSPPGFSRRDISSPTTMTDPDFATPTTERQSNPSNGTRCVCNSMDNGGHLMIQCESCTHWLHTKCVGLDRQSLPPVYICIYCSQTPMRGGRIRDPLGPGQIPTSPLAHKSYRSR
ncbi:hypothetical protein AJ79_06631 [Helicocarpus griseus UAMH5409]|uniref:PHD-type domain-containing protein n=1 Tax=Helicocarpus griseus UAMH5409 TaxID=1447875 RepID=A0A2B7XBL7_9EURO|nr:hypothetical protein AJ79_06631 [Helicocarpus griseus UAMH5409]